ncbi:Protein SpAN [Nymphon striatum]|nr:Protein SpAN [Nymphon striatum]
MSASVRSELQKSFNEWTTKTNIRFKERTNESNYVTISSSGDNSNSGVATLGMFGSQGYIRLGTRATAVVIIHEIGHTLGYIHEQNRSDRDSFVRINFQNIQDNAVSQFFKSNSASLVTSQFDINSTMMYGSYTFTKNGQPTITDLNGNVLPRRQAQVSSLDISGTNAIYPPVNGNNNSCGDVEEWSSGTRYFVGDRVTYREDAEDIVQESFVSAFKNLASFNYESTFGAWLKRIVINKSINYLKKKEIAVVPIDAHEFHLKDDVAIETEAVDIRKVKSGIEKLPAGYKQIINLYLVEGYDHIEIGEVLGITTSTSKSQYHRAKKKLVEIINEL